MSTLQALLVHPKTFGWFTKSAAPDPIAEPERPPGKRNAGMFASHPLRPYMMLFCLIAMLAAGGIHAQSAPAQFEGPDREQRLIDGARREGSLTVYTSMVDNDIRQLSEAFQKKYSVKVTFWRGSAQKVLQRTVAEARSGRNEVDVVQNPSVQMEALHEEKLLQSAHSPFVSELTARALPVHGEWVAMRAYVFVQAYNTQKVSKEELPRSFSDLLDPRWKGRLGIEAKGDAWFSSLLQAMGEEKGLSFFRQLVATNGLSVRSGNSVLNNLVVAGEVPFALGVYSYLPERAQRKGAPINWIALQPTIGYTDGIGIARHAPHPHAAALFVDFMLSDGLLLMKEQQQLTLHRRDEAALDRFKPTFIDPARMLVDFDKKAQLYQEIISGRPQIGAGTGGGK